MYDAYVIGWGCVASCKENLFLTTARANHVVRSNQKLVYRKT